ncbi:hypothetical protein SPO3064 [Ruegeria pomeroyi DSS-3]|uniref:Ribbon-helix-helix protein CopG domain-containing protein n=1 Tax=Ruegeria pomeroyi (strain ATCC 700808 / DSM 15171 / DSS-3) TaxID=246200 RepID=Q5LNY9_RUEPO|nr:hypothetical protein SPO3064 [Ruegeria pomeroyi DSS-3]HCE72053.1 hypothetical protein [Ruegeria sp.]
MFYALYIQCICEIFNRADGFVGKKDGKNAATKDAQLVLRLDKKERDAFVETCKALDTSAAREIRRFIREFMKAHQDS